MSGLELVPVGTILTILINQISKTIQAAKDVMFENESFRILANHLSDIEPVLQELQLQKLNDSPAARQALECLETDLKKANNLIEKYKTRGRFYLLVKCRHIVKEVEEVTRDIGKSLAALSLANVEILSGISEEVNRLQNEMQRAEFEASLARVQIVDRLNQALMDQVQDQEFANNLLHEIARVVGVPVEPGEINKELDSFKKEKEEAANRKERAEVFFLEQVIELLSRAEAARDYEKIRNQYFERLKVIQGYDQKEEYIHPFKAFRCCITRDVMSDPVSLCTGTACERAALEHWFNSGKRTDPDTGELLEDFSYRSNLQLRQSIQEWKELNYCLKIRSCKVKLQSEEESLIQEALGHIEVLIQENSINKDWISAGGITDILISMLGAINKGEATVKIMIVLKCIVEGHPINKDIFIKNSGIEEAIRCLESGSSISTAALELLYEVLMDKTQWNKSYCRKLYEEGNAIPSLVSIIKNDVPESARKAKEILLELCDEDEVNVVHAAQVGWHKPLIDRILQGSTSSREQMVAELVKLELDEEKKRLIGEEGIITSLLEMASGSIESKEVSLSALIKLLGCRENKKLMSAAGGVPLILNLMFSYQVRTAVIARCCEILGTLSSHGDGIMFLLDEHGNQIELEPVITNILSFLQNLNFNNIRRPALRALLGICQSETNLVKSAVLSASGVSVVLPFLDDSNQETREVAMNLLFLFSQHDPEGVVEYLLRPRRIETLVGFLENYDKPDVQTATTGLLANLPKSETFLTRKLIDLGGLQALINILREGNIEAKENALSALFRFTDPTNIESQHEVVKFGAFSLLVKLLGDDSVTVKARAAALLGDLSMRSPELTAISKTPGCWCFRRTKDPICPAHGGICNMNTTFCLLEGNALHGIINLLQEKDHATAYEAIQTLSTLVLEESPQRGASVLHENDAIRLIIEVLNWGSESLKGEALGLLERLFVSREMAELYGPTARLPLVRLTGRRIYEDGHLQRKAARVMLLIERYSKSSSFMSVSG